MSIWKAVRTAAVALVAAVTFAGTAQAAATAPNGKLTAELALLWTTVLERPSPQNSFGSGGDAYACWDLGRNVVAPFGPSEVPSCTVKPGTRIFLVGATYECSTPWEFAAGTDLVSCAVENDASTAPAVTLDGRPVSLSEVTTPVLPVTVPELPDDNVFGLPGGPGQFAAHGWAALLNPLTPGTHRIVGPTFTTTIIVQPGLH
jgi:hypothetical protein